EADVRVYEDLGREVREAVAGLPERPSELATWRSTWTADAAKLGGELARLRAALADRTFPDHAWNEALAIRARFAVGVMLWPDELDLAAALAAVEGFQSELGSREGAAALKQAAHDAAARETRMPAPAVRDALVEGQVRQAFDAQGWGEDVLAVHLQSAGWSVVTDGSGAVVGRTRSAWVAASRADGRCVLYDYTVFQARAGDGWGDVRRKSHASRGIARENVPGTTSGG
ncbi:MAG: hypothetical protein KC656_20600, partial [Myxococcales bacterium]|nr:hypothetical protein [Myxococcales bacterium]